MTATYIIKEDVSNDIINNITNITKFQEIQQKLQIVYFSVR